MIFHLTNRAIIKLCFELNTVKEMIHRYCGTDSRVKSKYLPLAGDLQGPQEVLGGGFQGGVLRPGQHGHQRGQLHAQRRARRPGTCLFAVVSKDHVTRRFSEGEALLRSYRCFCSHNTHPTLPDYPHRITCTHWERVARPRFRKTLASERPRTREML